MSDKSYKNESSKPDMKISNQLKYNKPEEYRPKDAIGKLLSSLADEYSNNEMGYRDKKNHSISQAYEHASVIRSTEDVAADFCRLEAWEGQKSRPNVDKPNDYLRHALRLVIGLDKRSTRKEASKIAAALETAWADMMPSCDIANYIKDNGGISGLLKLRSEQKKKKLEKKKTKKKAVSLSKHFDKFLSPTKKHRNKLKSLKEGEVLLLEATIASDGKALILTAVKG